MARLPLDLHYGKCVVIGAKRQKRQTRNRKKRMMELVIDDKDVEEVKALCEMLVTLKYNRELGSRVANTSRENVQ